MSASQRVLLVSPVGTIGGGEEVLLALIRHLPAVGYTADLVCLRPGPLAAAGHAAGASFTAEGRPHRMRELRKVQAARQWLSDIVRHRKPAVVHSNHMAHLYCHGLAKRCGTREVWHIHDYPHHLDWADRLCRLVATDHVIFTTNFVRSGYPLVARRYSYSVVPPSAPALSAVNEVEPAVLRVRFDLPVCGVPLFLTATRMQPHKGHKVLLSASRIVLEQCPDAMFVITGEATDPIQSTYLSELKSSAARLGVDHAVRFVGRVTDAELVGLYALATALVHPAITEGFGLALANAMRAGVPVIAADAAGPREVLENGTLGTLVPRGDATALAAAMIKVHRQQPDVSEIATISAKRFAPTVMAAAIAKIYNKLTGVVRQ